MLPIGGGSFSIRSVPGALCGGGFSCFRLSSTAVVLRTTRTVDVKQDFFVMSTEQSLSERIVATTPSPVEEQRSSAEQGAHAASADPPTSCSATTSCATEAASSIAPSAEPGRPRVP